jgi:hypothetical protein
MRQALQILALMMRHDGPTSGEFIAQQFVNAGIEDAELLAEAVTLLAEGLDTREISRRLMPAAMARVVRPCEWSTAIWATSQPGSCWPSKSLPPHCGLRLIATSAPRLLILSKISCWASRPFSVSNSISALELDHVRVSEFFDADCP